MKTRFLSFTWILLAILVVGLESPMAIKAENGVIVTVPKTEAERLIMRINADSKVLLKKLKESSSRAGISYYFNVDNTAEVAEVYSPAKKAGLKKGDKILSANDETFLSEEDSVKKISGRGKAGAAVNLLVERADGTQKNVVVTTAEFKVQDQDKSRATELQKEIEEEVPKFIADIKDIIDNKDSKELIGVYLSYSMWLYSMSDEIDSLIKASE